MGPTGKTIEQRFWNRVTKTKHCWLWDRVNSFGYGKFSIKINGKWTMQWAHRLSYEFIKGPIPLGFEIDHLCRNRICVNPEHLEAVEKRINILRGESIQAKNKRKTHCIRGHEFNKENTGIIKNKKGRYCKLCHKMHQIIRRSLRK